MTVPVFASGGLLERDAMDLDDSNADTSGCSDEDLSMLMLSSPIQAHASLLPGPSFCDDVSMDVSLSGSMEDVDLDSIKCVNEAAMDAESCDLDAAHSSAMDITLCASDAEKSILTHSMVLDVATLPVSGNLAKDAKPSSDDCKMLVSDPATGASAYFGNSAILPGSRAGVLTGKSKTQAGFTFLSRREYLLKNQLDLIKLGLANVTPTGMLRFITLMRKSTLNV